MKYFSECLFTPTLLAEAIYTNSTHRRVIRIVNIIKTAMNHLGSHL